MRIVALDVGDKRIGVAKSDPLNIIAQGVGVIYVKPKIEKTYHEIVEMLEKEAAELLVVGLPKNMDGTIGFQGEKVRNFVDEILKLKDIPVEYVDERLTTVTAGRTLIEGDVSRKKRKDVIDKLSAVIILQSYLDRKA